MEKELVVGFDDLLSVSITCQREGCGAQTLVSISNKQELPIRCLACGENEPIRDHWRAVELLVSGLQGMKGAPVSIRVRG